MYMQFESVIGTRRVIRKKKSLFKKNIYIDKCISIFIKKTKREKIIIKKGKKKRCNEK